MNTEPALTSGAVTGVVSAVLVALVAFNVPLTPDQIAAILGLAAAVFALPIVGSLWTRTKVTPVTQPRE